MGGSRVPADMAGAFADSQGDTGMLNIPGWISEQ